MTVPQNVKQFSLWQEQFFVIFQYPEKKAAVSAAFAGLDGSEQRGRRNYCGGAGPPPYMKLTR